MSIHVNVDNFVQAETARMFAGIQRDAGGVNVFQHNREPASIDAQTVIRLNRDTLYSFAIVDLANGATLTLPEAGDRYMSAMIVNEGHLINEIFHDAGRYELTEARFESRYVMVGVRTLVDPANPEDVAAVGALQDQIGLDAGAGEPFALPDYDTAAMDATRDALLALASGMQEFDGAFGSAEQIEPVRHLIGTAAGWGGLPTTETTYIGVDPESKATQELTLRDVPVDAFWSVSVYNARGFFEPNDRGVYNVNSVTAVPNDDGSVTVRFDAGGSADAPNTIPVPEGWNYLVRLYRPRAEVTDGTWQLPELTSA